MTKTIMKTFHTTTFDQLVNCLENMPYRKVKTLQDTYGLTDISDIVHRIFDDIQKNMGVIDNISNDPVGLISLLIRGNHKSGYQIDAILPADSNWLDDLDYNITSMDQVVSKAIIGAVENSNLSDIFDIYKPNHNELVNLLNLTVAKAIDNAIGDFFKINTFYGNVLCYWKRFADTSLNSLFENEQLSIDEKTRCLVALYIDNFDKSEYWFDDIWHMTELDLINRVNQLAKDIKLII